MLHKTESKYQTYRTVKVFVKMWIYASLKKCSCANNFVYSIQKVKGCQEKI